MGILSQEQKDKILLAVTTHKEGDDLGYCDTGSDMELQCRSDCSYMAEKRVREVLETL